MLEAVNISKSYSGGDLTRLDVLRAVNLAIAQGECVAILGPSGAGKSTLLHILGGLDDPNEGKVFLDGQSLYEMNETARAKIRNTSVGFVFQFYHLLPEFTALENVLMPLMIKHDKSNTKDFEEKGMELLRQVGMEKRSTHRPQQLSGGEQQRIAIARALINEPKIILCDEPTGNLDSANSLGIMDLLLGLNKKNKQTVVVVTHQEDLAQKADRILFMRDGILTHQEINVTR